MPAKLNTPLVAVSLSATTTCAVPDATLGASGYALTVLVTEGLSSRSRPALFSE